ncbi:MAG: hypothetical protein F4043_07650 [Gammaproteobacteria bacterium]|nr:hypothetical protein [Gammaproteobacteria bacterium]MYC98978.1 hypothetical protein [Gammaproteobacteria bacterium]MYI22572.1 hypothetical protein [Gammaproteobacteria bacterium]
MSWKCRVRGRPLRPCALAGTLSVGLMSAGCVFISDDESHAEAGIEEVRESMHEAADEFADGLADAASQLAGALHGIDLELSGETLVERPVSFRALRDVLPDEAGGFSLSSREGSTVGALGFRVSKVEAEYGNGDGADVDVTIADIGALPMVGSEDFLDWLDVEIDEENGRGWQRTLEYEGYPALAEFRSRRGDRGRAQFTWLVEGRFVVSMEGYSLTMDELYDLRDAIDTDALTDMRNREG